MKNSCPESSQDQDGMANKYLLLGLAILIALGGAGYVYFSKPAVLKTPVTVVENQTPVQEPEALENNYKEENVPLSQVPNFTDIKSKFGLKLTANQEKFLNENKFLLVAKDQTTYAEGVNFDQMLADFDSIGGNPNSSYRKPNDTKLVTPDIVLHAYHKFFELTLEELEKGELSYALGNFLTSMHENLATAAKNSTGTLKERYQNLEAQIVLARVLFENKSPSRPDYFSGPDAETNYEKNDKTIDSLANAEKILGQYSSDLPSELVGAIKKDLADIFASKSIGQSPLYGQYYEKVKTDYTQYTPRSHYTKTSGLRAYFRTMMHLGRSSYFLKNDIGIIDANLLVKQFEVKSSKGLVPYDSWKKIMDVTGFYAGQSDDLGYNEWQEYLNKILGPTVNAADLVSSASIEKLAQNLNQVRLPKILSDVVVSEEVPSQTKADLLRDSLAYRIFGQRFTFDAWVLNTLTKGQEKSAFVLPSTPSALFISAAMGDARAQQHSQTFLKNLGYSETDLKSFQTAAENSKQDIAKVKKSEWFSSMGSAWLYVLGSLTHNFGTNYPRYMQTASFLDKQIQTFLGSFTELKHDTLLYAKQSYAEMGGGGGDEPPVPPVVKGFVEPNLEFWNKFSELLDQTEQFFVKNDLLKDSSPLSRLRSFKEIIGFYGQLAKQELAGTPISESDYEKLRTTSLSFMSMPFDGSVADSDSSQVALIADIHTDMLLNQILYEATAKPYLMLAVVANENAPRIVASFVYNHYELTNPIEKRLTDEDWKGWVYKEINKLPAKNFWYQSLLIK